MKKFFAFYTVSRNVYWLGFVIAVAASLIELLRGGAENYCVFRDATLQFWQGINPYTQEFVDVHHRYFIYSPIFCVLFAPFAFMPFYLGGLVWNLFGYTVFYFGVKNLPGVLSAKAPLIMLYLRSNLRLGIGTLGARSGFLGNPAHHDLRYYKDLRSRGVGVAALLSAFLA